MKAAVLIAGHTAPGSLLQIEEVPRPEAQAGYVLLRVLACGVCRTDLHIAEGDLPQPLTHPGPPDCRRGGGRRDGRTAAGQPGRGLLDRRRRWRVLVLPSRDGRSVRSAHVYRIHGQWWLCRVRPGAGGFSAFHCRPAWMTSMWRRCCAPGLSAFAACGWRA